MIKGNVINKIGFIGSGKVATQLAIGLNARGVDVMQIYSRTYANAELLANKVSAVAIDNVSDFNPDLDLIIVSITDSSILKIDLSFVKSQTLLVHTSGSLSIDVLNINSNYGVFYPLQTFNLLDKPNWNNIPFCIEANTNNNFDKLFNLAKLLSDKVYNINSEKRAILHLSAVFLCNFSNAMYAIGEELLDEYGLNLDLLHPLIEETANKAIINSPKMVQTGPAVRNDKLIIEKHINRLTAYKDYSDLYKLMTKIIYKQQNNI